MVNNAANQIKKSILDWLESSEMQQKELAEKLEVSPASVNRMLKEDFVTALPLSRFLQIVHLLKPKQTEIDRVFGLYCQELKLPAGALKLTIGRPAGTAAETARERLHALIDKLDEKDCETVEVMLSALARK